MPPKRKQAQSLEETLWDAATALRSSMDAAEYKHVVLGLIFLKYRDRPRTDLVRGRSRDAVGTVTLGVVYVPF